MNLLATAADSGSSFDATAITTAIVAVLTAVAGFFGAVKLLRDSGSAQSNQVVTSYKELADELREQRKEDREAHQRDMDSIRGRLDTAEAEIALLRAQAEKDKGIIRRLLQRITYLTSLLALHAPDVTLDPMPDDLQGL